MRVFSKCLSVPWDLLKGLPAPTESNVAPFFFFLGKSLPKLWLSQRLVGSLPGVRCPQIPSGPSGLGFDLLLWRLHLDKWRSFLYRLSNIKTRKGGEVATRRGEEPRNPHSQQGGGPSETRGCADASLRPSALVAGKKDVPLATARGHGSVLGDGSGFFPTLSSSRGPQGVPEAVPPQ